MFQGEWNQLKNIIMHVRWKHAGTIVLMFLKMKSKFYVTFKAVRLLGAYFVDMTQGL